MRKILRLSLMISMLLAYFIGCGESGGLRPSSSSLSFPSNAVSAEATIENGVQIKNIVVKDQQSAYSVSNSVTNSNNQNMLVLMRKVNYIFKETINSKSYALNAVKEETKKCKNGGSASVSTSVSSNNANVTITMTFNNCKLNTEGNIIVNGTIYTVAERKGNIAILNMKYLTDLTISSDSINGKIEKGTTMDIVYEASNNATQDIKLTISAIVHEGTKISGQQNAVYHMKNKYSLYQTSGKVYINNLASYVDYDTSYDMSKTPFVLSGTNITSGEARYNMENGGKVKIVAENNKAKIYIDKDGDGNYELSE